MYTERQLERMFGRLERLEEMLEPKLFYTADTDFSQSGADRADFRDAVCICQLFSGAVSA